jgi:UDP-N-acetylmuramyl pentapeptide synthase
MNDDIAIDYKLTLPPPTEGQAKEADKLAVGIFTIAEKWNASPQVMLYALHRVLHKMEEMARSHD